MSLRASDVAAWIDMLDKAEVNYIVVGGLGGLAHGSDRPTIDIDIVPEWRDQNLENVCDFLRSINAQSRTGPVVFGDEITPDLLREREVLNWTTSLGDIDTLMGIPNAKGEAVDFEMLSERASTFSITSGDHQGNFVVAHLEDIIISKRYANRAKDRAALPKLEQLLQEQLEAEVLEQQAPAKTQEPPELSL